MASETDTPASLIVQARDEEDIDRITRNCDKGTENHPKQQCSFDDEGTKDDEERKNDVKVKESTNICTEGESSLYSSSAKIGPYEHNVKQLENCLDGMSSDDTTLNLDHDKQKLDNEEVATADEQASKRPRLDANRKDNSQSSDRLISDNQNIVSEQNSTKEVNDNKGKSKVEVHPEHLDHFSLQKQDPVKTPACALDQQLEGDELDEKSKNKSSYPEMCIGETYFSNPAASPENIEATVSETDDLVKGPKIMAETEKKKPQRDGEGMMTPCGLENFDLSQMSSSLIDSNKGLISETMKDVKDQGGVWESNNTFENNLEKASKSMLEKDVEGMTRSSETYRYKTEMEDKNFDSNIKSQKDEEVKNGGKHGGDAFLSKIDSEITPTVLNTLTEKPEECTRKAMMREEGSGRGNLNKDITLISETTGAIETTEPNTFTELSDTNLGMANPDDQLNKTDTLEVGDCDKAKSPQDVTTEAIGNSDKQDEFSENQLKEREKQKIVVSSEGKVQNEQASNASICKEFTNTERSSDVDAKTKPDEKREVVSDVISIAQEKISEFVEPKPEIRQEIQNAEGLTEIETKKKASDANFQENNNQKISDLTESTDNESMNSKVHLPGNYMGDNAMEERSDSKQDTGKTNEVVAEEMSISIPDEFNEKTHMLPENHHDIAFPVGSKNRAETIFTVISIEEKPLQDQFKSTDDDSYVTCESKGKEKSDTTELDSETHRSESSIEVQKDINLYQVNRSKTADRADIVEDVNNINHQTEEGNNYLGDQNQISYTRIEFEGQKQQVDAKDDNATKSDFANLSYDSMELAETKEAPLDVGQNQGNKDTNNTRGIPSTEENIEPADTIEKPDDMKPDVANENSVTSDEAKKFESSENSMVAEKQDSLSTEKILCGEHNENQDKWSTKTEILEVGESIKKVEEADEKAKQQDFHEQKQRINEYASEEGLQNCNMEIMPDDKIETTKSDSPQLHDTNSMEIKVEAHERCGSNDVQEVKGLENIRVEESSSDKAKGMQGSVEIFQIFNLPTDSNEESISETMKDVKDDSGFWESNNIVEDSLEKVSKSVLEKDVEGMTGSSETYMYKAEMEDKSIDSNIKSQKDEKVKNEGEKHQGDAFSAKIDSEITPMVLNTATEKPEECTVKAMIKEEGSDRGNLNKDITLISETTEAIETTEANTFSKLSDTNLVMANSDDQLNNTDTLKVENCDTAKSPQDVTTEAKEKSNKQDVCSENQLKEREKQKIEVSSEGEVLNDQASNVSISKEFRCTETNSDIDAKTKPDEKREDVSDVISIAQEKFSGFAEPEPERRQDMQNAEGYTEIETKRKVSEANIQENSIDNNQKISDLTESTDNESMNRRVHLPGNSMDNNTTEERSDSKQDTGETNDLTEMVSISIPEEFNKTPFKLPQNHRDIAFSVGSKKRNETISAISIEENPMRQKDQFKCSDDDSYEGCESKGKENSDTTELDSEKHKFEVQKDINPYQVNRSNTTNRADTVEDVNKFHNQIGNGNNYLGHRNQRSYTCMDFKGQEQQVDAKDDNASKSDSANLSYDSLELVETKEATLDIAQIQENKGINNIKGIASAKENIEQADAAKKPDDMKPDAANDNNSVTSAKAKPFESSENSIIAEKQYSLSTEKVLCDEHDENEYMWSTTTEILEVEESIRKVEEADEKGKQQDFHEQSQSINEYASEEGLRHISMENMPHDKEFENTKSDSPPHHDTNSMEINVEAHERFGSNDVQEVKRPENIRFEESSPDKAKGMQGSVENFQIQSKIYENDGIQTTVFEPTTDTQHCSTEDEILFNIVNDVSVEQDTNTKSYSIEEHKGESTPVQTGSIEIQETKAISNEEIGNQHFKKSASCPIIPGPNAKESAPTIEDPNHVLSKECTGIGNDTQADDVEEEKTNEQLQGSLKITNDASTYKIREGNRVEKKQNIKNIVEDMDKDMSDKSENTDVLHDENTLEKVASNEIYKQVENCVASNDKHTRSSFAAIPFNKIEEEASIEEQQYSTEDLNVITNDISSHKDSRVEIEQENDNSTNIVKDLEQTSPLQDIEAESQTISILKDRTTNEKTSCNDTHEAKLATNEDIVIQNSKASSPFCGKQDEEILEAPIPHITAENIASSKDECTRIPNEEIHVDDVETKISVENDKKAQSSDIEEAEDEKTNEQSCLNDNHGLQVTENQSFEESNFSGKQNQEISHASKLFLEAENPIPSTYECTQVSDEKVQACEVEKVAMTEKWQFRAQKLDINTDKYEVSPHEFELVHNVQENENSMDSLDDTHEDKLVESETEVQNIQIMHGQPQKTKEDINGVPKTIEVSKEDKIHEQTCSNDIHEAMVVSNDKVVYQSPEESDSCCVKQDQVIAQASKPALVEVASQVSRKDQCTRIFSEDIHDNEVEEEEGEATGKQQCYSEFEDGKNINTGVSSSEVHEADNAKLNESSINIEDSMDKDLDADSHSMEAEKKEIQGIEVVNHKEIVYQRFKVSDCAEGIMHFIEAETHVPSNEEYPSISSEIIQFSELEEEAKFKQNRMEEDQKEITNSVSSFEFKEDEIVPEHENSVHIIQDVNQITLSKDLNTELERIKAKGGGNKIQETKGVDNEVIEAPISAESYLFSGKPDKEIAEPSKQFIEDDSHAQSKSSCNRIYSKEIQVTNVAKELVTEETNMTGDGVSGNLLKIVPVAEIEPANEYSTNIVEDVDQDINPQANVIELQKHAKAHEQSESHEIHETQAVKNEEIVNQCSKESDFLSRKQDQETNEASELIIEVEAPIPSIDEDSRVSSEQCPCPEQEQEINYSGTRDGVSSHQITLSGKDNSMQKIEDVDQDTHAQQNTIEVHKDETRYKQTTRNEIQQKHEVSNEEIHNQYSEDGTTYYEKMGQDIAETSTSLTKAESPVPSNEERTRISSDKIQCSEVNEADTIDKQQCRSDPKDPNNIENGVSSCQVEVELMIINVKDPNQVKQAKKPISKNLTDTVSETVKYQEQGASIEEQITNVQNVKALEVSSTEELENSEHADDRKRFQKEDEDLNIQAATEVRSIQLTEANPDSREKNSKELYPKQYVEVEEFGDAKQEINFPKDTVSFVKYTDADETVQRDIWQTNELQDKLQELSSEHLETKQVVTKTEDIQERTKTMKVLKEEKPDECSLEKASLEKYLSDEEQRELEVSNSEIIQSADLQQKKDVITEESPIPEQELSSKLQGAIYPSDSVQNSTAEITKKCCSQETIHVDDEFQFLEKSEQINVTVQHDSSSLPASVKTIMSEIDADIQGKPENFEQITKKYDQEGMNSEDSDREENHKKADSTLIMEGNPCKNLEDSKVSIDDTTNTKKTETIDKKEMVIMIEAQDTNTKCSTSSVDGADFKATRQVPPENKDSKEFNQIESMKILYNPLIHNTTAEKEQGICDNLPVSTQFQGPCDDVPKEKGIEELDKDTVAIGDERQLQKVGKEEPDEEHNKTEACAEEDLFVNGSKRNESASLPPSDLVKESLEQEKEDDLCIVKDVSKEHGNQERTDEDLYEIEADSYSKENVSAQRNLDANDRTAEEGNVILHKETKDTAKITVKSISDEEKEEEQDSDLKLPLISETSRDTELKAGHKKSHNILSGVGSKVKHSISKVKKAMTCTSSQFAPEDALIKLNKHKKSSDKASKS